MGAYRITQQMMVSRVLRNLSLQNRRILDLQEQLSTGQSVNRPSDNPMAARRAINAQNVLAQNTQYLTNISTIGPYLTETETSISTVEDFRQRAYELTLQGLSDTNGQTQRDQIALEINSILEDVITQGNYVSNGRYIFAGTRTATKPFTATRNAAGESTAVAFEGNTETFEIEICTGTRVTVNQSGEDVFLQTTGTSVNIFETLINIRDHLRAGDTASLQSDLEDLVQSQDQLMVAVAKIGATQSRIESVEGNLRDINTQMEKVISDNIDADFADVVVNLNSQSNAFQASLSAAARVIQPSLLDFLG
ncbi:MAG TPA: flagellar hook-associated protein FlgL [Candidatus Hydrogenedentes bacterium]|nr:flagellar hook-associated protein FlgL [Candidatus Hydrogenedentota bacterium]